MDIQKIKYFVEVVRAKSFSGAAQNLFVSQSMLSKAIQQLEAELDARLIDRSSKHFQVTDVGTQFYERCILVLDEFNDLGTFFLNEVSDVSGSVSISIPAAILTLYFPELLTKFQKKYPNIRIDLFEEGSYSVLNSVITGAVDLGIVMMPVCAQDIDIIPLLEDHCVLVTGREHELAEHTVVDFKQLENERFIIFNPRFVLNDMILQACHTRGFSPRIIYQSALDSFVFRMVSLGHGISILPRPLVINAGYTLNYADLDPAIPWKLALILKKKKYRSIATQKTIDSILEFFHS